MVTSVSVASSCSSFWQNGQSGSANTAIGRLPLPLTTLMACATGSLPKSMDVRASMLTAVRSFLVFVSISAPVTRCSPVASA